MSADRDSVERLIDQFHVLANFVDEDHRPLMFDNLRVVEQAWHALLARCEAAEAETRQLKAYREGDS